MCGKNFFIILTRKGKLLTSSSLLVVLLCVSTCSLIFANNVSCALSSKNIIIDPGHGGIDGGTNDGIVFFEKDINLLIGTRLQSILNSKNANVEMTRSSDISLDENNTLSSSRHKRDLLERINQINSGKYDLFVSIHVNYSSRPSSKGPIVYYSSRIPQNTVLANCIQSSLNNFAKKFSSGSAPHRPVRSDLFVLVNTKIPGVIVESGFISNPAEKKLLEDSIYQQKLALSIAEGIEDYYRQIAKK